MEYESNPIISQFDQITTNNQIQMLKILLAYLPDSTRGTLSVTIKFLELQQTIRIFRHPVASLLPSRKIHLEEDLFRSDNHETILFLDELLPYSSADERKKIENIKAMLENLSKMKGMMEMINTMKELFPEESGDGEDNPTNLFSSLSGLSEFFQNIGDD